MQVYNLTAAIQFREREKECVCVVVYVARVGAKYFNAQYLIGYDDYTNLLKITFISLTYLNSRTLRLSTENRNANSSPLY